ncbi:MAG: rod shape-determining protein MreC [Cyclobacteriaceae bacterium]
MRKLFDFLYRRRTIAIFICLEAVCFWLVVNFNQRQNADFLNSSNALSAEISMTSQNISDYFELDEINDQLMQENALLQSRLNIGTLSPDSIWTYAQKYQVIDARVINNTFRRSTNFLTITGGKKAGIIPGMGVISPAGVVGQVKSVSDNYATIYSVLHPKMLVSSVLSRTKTKCTVQWEQEAYDIASLKYIPRHINLNVGDTIVTSGFNSVFPPNIIVGVVSEFNLEEHMTFYDAKVRLSVDFTSLPNVFVIISEEKAEKDSLELL